MLPAPVEKLVMPSMGLKLIDVPLNPTNSSSTRSRSESRPASHQQKTTMGLGIPDLGEKMTVGLGFSRFDFLF